MNDEKREKKSEVKAITVNVTKELNGNPDKASDKIKMSTRQTI